MDKNARFADTMPLAKVLEQFIQMYRLRYGLQKAQLPTLWKELMGNAIAKYTHSVELKGTTLYVTLSSPALNNELSYGKTKIIALLNEALGSESIQKLIFLN